MLHIGHDNGAEIRKARVQKVKTSGTNLLLKQKSFNETLLSNTDLRLVHTFIYL